MKIENIICYDLGLADSGNDNVSLLDDLGEVSRLGVANGHGRVLLDEEERHGDANQIAETT